MDSSLFTVAATVTWALQSRRANQKKQAHVRLNLQWAATTGTPEGVSIGGEDSSEAAALMASLGPDLIYVLDRGYVNFKLLDRILHACSDFVVRLKKNNLFVPVKTMPLSDQDLAAGVISDRIGRLSGSGDCQCPAPCSARFSSLTPTTPISPCDC